MLDDEVVEVEEPQRPVGADFGMDGGEPFVVARGDIPAVFFGEAGTATLDDRAVHDMACRFVHERDAVPILLGEGSSRVEVVTRGRGKPALHINLTYFCVLACMA